MKIWFTSHFADFANTMAQDLKSLRALWSWIYLALYVWVIVWGVLFYANICLNTAITATSAIVMAALTNYVWSKNSEKKNGFVATMNRDYGFGSQGKPSEGEDNG